MSQIAGSVLALNDEQGPQQIATVRSKADLPLASGRETGSQLRSAHTKGH